MVYGTIERFLSRRTELFLFESAFARNAYEAHRRRAARRRARGVQRHQRRRDGAGRARPRRRRSSSASASSAHIKGTDVLIDALAELHRSGRRVSLAIAGDGEEGPALRDAGGATGPDRQHPLPRPHAGADRPSPRAASW